MSWSQCLPATRITPTSKPRSKSTSTTSQCLPATRITPTNKEGGICNPVWSQCLSATRITPTDDTSFRLYGLESQCLPATRITPTRRAKGRKLRPKVSVPPGNTHHSDHRGISLGGKKTSLSASRQHASLRLFGKQVIDAIEKCLSASWQHASLRLYSCYLCWSMRVSVPPGNTHHSDLSPGEGT